MAKILGLWKYSFNRKEAEKSRKERSV